MKKLFVIAIVTTALLAPGVASAGERVNDMALGAASGALVGGPVGLVAGGVIGYVAGPDIGRSLGFKRHHSERRSAVRRSDKAVEARPAAEAPADGR
jgi:hypothetical protein